MDAKYHELYNNIYLKKKHDLQILNTHVALINYTLILKQQGGDSYLCKKLIKVYFNSIQLKS